MVSPFVSSEFSVSFSLASACFSESETFCFSLTVASSALEHKHDSLHNNRPKLPLNAGAENGWASPSTAFFPKNQ